MDKNIKPGTEVYSSDGRMGRYVGPVAYGHAVEPVFEHDDGPTHYGDVQSWSHVHLKPPTETLHAECAELQETITRRRVELEAVRMERQALDAELKERQKRFIAHAQLNLLDDFIAGKITHLVIDDTAYGINIQTAEKALDYQDGDRWVKHKKLKLLSLYGDSKGDLTWGLSSYSDGSDNGQKRVIPCTSYEAAVVAATALIEVQFDACRKLPNRPWMAAGCIKAAEAIGMPVPKDLADMHAAYKRKSAAEDLAKAEVELVKASARVNDLFAQAREVAA